MLTVYLDQNKWIDLARAYHDRADGRPFLDVLELAEYASEHRLASFPLSTMHYLETWKHADEGKRERLALVMARLSRFDTIASISHVLPAEIEAALNRLFGRPARPRRLRVFGRGISHAFGKDLTIKLQRVEDIPASIQDELHHELWKLSEFWYIGALRPSEEVPPLQTEGLNRFSTEFMDAEKTIVAAMEEARAAKDDRDRVALVRTVLDVIAAGPLFDICARAGVTREEFYSLGAEGLLRFVQLLPSRHVNFELQKLRYEDSALPRREGDLLDLEALSIAVAYCDVVITERHWVHLIKRAGLHKLRNTTVLSDLRQLGPILVKGEARASS